MYGVVEVRGRITRMYVCGACGVGWVGCGVWGGWCVGGVGVGGWVGWGGGHSLSGAASSALLLNSEPVCVACDDWGCGIVLACLRVCVCVCVCVFLRVTACRDSRPWLLLGGLSAWTSVRHVSLSATELHM